MPQPVETAPVETGRVEDQVDAVGSLTPNESANIAPEIAGRITALPFTEGQRVKAGALLVELDPSILQAELKQAEAELTLAEEARQRTTELVKRGAGTVVAQQQANAQFVAGQVKVDVANTRLEKTKLVAPFDGIVGLRSISVGNYVNVGQAIVALTSVDPIKLNFRIPEIYLASVKPGQKVSARMDARPDRVYEGEVYAIDPVIDENGRAISLRALIANRDNSLAPGLFARVAITTAVRENALLVPESALVTQPTGAIVYVVEGDVARLRNVKTGRRASGKVEITEGLKAGDVVVTAGQMRLREGTRVNIAKPAQTPASAAAK